MTFDELLDQIVELLQRRGRVTYRALEYPLKAGHFVVSTA
jgi:hypothetical protein